MNTPQFTIKSVTMEWNGSLAVAVVETPAFLLTFSMRSDETEWYLDTLMRKDNGVVSFAHGPGNRSTLKQTAGPDLKTALNEELAQKIV